MKHKKILLLLLIIVLMGLFTAYNAFFINPKVITVEENTIVSDKIGHDLDGFTVVFFTDLHYTTSIKQEELQNLTDLINSFDPDVILFGGDLVDHYSRNLLNESEEANLTQGLKDMKARYGKYAVLGNHDIDSDIIVENVTRILTAADFSILNNQNIKVRNGGSSYLNIVGIESMMLGNPDISLAYEGISDNAYTIALCHTPDIFDTIDTNKTDLLLAGHSHGGQINIPLIVNNFLPDGAKKYFHGRYVKDNTILDVSNGVGTTKNEARIFADAQINVYKFKSGQ